jgi:hypothetical protein
MRNRDFWRRILDRAQVAGLALVILGLVSVQLFDVAGLSAAFGRGDTALDLQETSSIVAPVLQADLGDGETDVATSGTLRASVWLAPIASLRGGFGLGLLETIGTQLDAIEGGRRELRIRFGGGLMAPLTPSMGVDLHAGA